MRRVRILQEAAEEATPAAGCYEREKPGLGTEFFDAVEAAIDLFEEDIPPLSPLPGKSGATRAKRIVLKRFPCDIVVIERASEAIIVTVAHHSRKPGYWREGIGP